MTGILDTAPCPAPAWLPGGHLQTLYGALMAPTNRLSFVRERVNTPDGDFIDLDWSAPGLTTQPDRGRVKDRGNDQGLPGRPPNEPPNNLPTDWPTDLPTDLPTELPGKGAASRWITDYDREVIAGMRDSPALVLLHGLEGNSASRYVQSILQYFRARGWLVVLAHFRGCSGVPNRLARAYFSGDSDEVGFILRTVIERAPEANWNAVGVSLGGNALLKYLGEHASETPKLVTAASICAPLDLVAAGTHLSTNWIGRHLYTRFFLRTMKPKTLEKATRFPGAIDVTRVSRARTLRDFDDAYTAPMHGFVDAQDYWTKASSKPWLPYIQVPTLVLNARNDPFVPEPSLPGPHEASASVTLHQPAEGGHSGFTTGSFPGNLTWLPARLARFFQAHSA